MAVVLDAHLPRFVAQQVGEVHDIRSIGGVGVIPPLEIA
jgi:hypothetical protein